MEISQGQRREYGGGSLRLLVSFGFFLLVSFAFFLRREDTNRICFA